jgi:hypothetical protein
VSGLRAGKRTVRNFGAAYCAISDVLSGATKFVASCSVACKIVDWSVAMYTRSALLLCDCHVAVYDSDGSLLPQEKHTVLGVNTKKVRRENCNNWRTLATKPEPTFST